MPTDVVLVHAPFVGDRYAEHLGLAYLAACLRRAGVQTQILDAQMLRAGVRRVVDLVAEAAPRVVGVTATQREARAVVAIVQGIRRKLPTVHIAAGGHFPTFCHDRLLRDVPALDSVVRGEGDLVFVGLVQRVLAGEEWHGLPGVSFRHDGAVVSTPPGPLVANLDSLPFAARDTARIAMAHDDLLGVSSSRGCYGRCTFCSISSFYRLQSGSAWRARSPQNVVEEMARLAGDYGCKRFSFVDDTFVGPGLKGRERTHAFADELIRRRLRCQFSLECRANDVERSVFLHLREAGLRVVWLGLESGSQGQLDRFRKGTTVEDGRYAFSILRDLGIDVGVFLIMFDPDATLDECLGTLRFVASAGLLRNALGFDSRARALDGTEVCERLREQGRLRGSYMRGYSYSFRDPTAGACARVVRPLAWLLTAVPNPFAPRRGRPAAR